RSDDTRALQILKDLLEKPWRDALSLGDVLDLRGLALVVEGDVEQRPNRVAALFRELHDRRYALSHRICQESPQVRVNIDDSGRIHTARGPSSASASGSGSA